MQCTSNAAPYGAMLKRTCVHLRRSLQDLHCKRFPTLQPRQVLRCPQAVCHSKHPDSSRAQEVDQLVWLGTMADEGQKAGLRLQNTGHNEIQQDNQAEVAEKFSTTEEACTAHIARPNTWLEM